jgi:hypothetical protein
VVTIEGERARVISGISMYYVHRNATVFPNILLVFFSS